MQVLLGVYAATTLALHLVGSLQAWLGTRRVVRLAHIDPPREAHPPRVSVVVAARDEAGTIQSALGSLLAQDYPDLEIVVVDDRSSDGTGEVAAEVAAKDERVRALRIDALPSGWLGKNHALARGAGVASGRYLLFTDADVEFAPDTISKAIAHARSGGVDHLAAAPGIRARSWTLALLVGTFAVLFGRFTKPWRASDPRSSAFIGIGAFNLVRREAYEAAGGHRAIRLRVDDDLRLGELLKRRGFHQEFVIGGNALVVEWYPSLVAMVQGLEKNAFAGLDFRVEYVALVVGALLGLFVLPFALLGALAWTGGSSPAILGLLLGICLVLVVGHAAAARDSRIAWWPAVLAPLGVLGFVYTLLRSTVLTLRRGGVAWRGTLYPLRELREAAGR